MVLRVRAHYSFFAYNVPMCINKLRHSRIDIV